MSESMVDIRSVTKIYERGKQKVEVLHGLSLEIPKGDFVALMGPSGSGKTTLLNLIGVWISPPRVRSAWGAAASTGFPAASLRTGGRPTSALSSSSTT